MPKRLSSLLCASALFLGSAGMAAMMPVTAQAAGIQVGFNFFHDRLAASGRWIHHPVWGDVWRPRPRLVGADFQPYSNGHWELTDEYGWYWVSDDPFDDVVYHYGRWVYDPQAHWLWVPGYTWAPAWVSWRESDDYTGWMPLPPDESFISGTAMSFGVELGPVGIDFYRKWYGGRVDPDRFYVFVGNAHLVDRDYRRFVVPRERVVTIINRTRPVTRFEIVNDRVVNRGVDVRIIERASGHRIAPVSAKIVVKPNAVITTVGEAKQIRTRERAAHPIDENAARRGGAMGGGAMDGAGGNGAKGGGEATGEGGARRDNGAMGERGAMGAGGGKNRAATTPATDTGAKGETNDNATTGEAPKKTHTHGNAGDATPEGNGTMSGPGAASPKSDSTSATTGAGETPSATTPKRHHSTTGAGDQTGSAGSEIDAKPVHRQRRNAVRHHPQAAPHHRRGGRPNRYREFRAEGDNPCVSGANAEDAEHRRDGQHERPRCRHRTGRQRSAFRHDCHPGAQAQAQAGRRERAGRYAAHPAAIGGNL